LKPIIDLHLFLQSGDKYAASARSVKDLMSMCLKLVTFGQFGVMLRNDVEGRNYQIFKDAFEKKK
jgi:hypothetical protein